MLKKRIVLGVAAALSVIGMTTSAGYASGSFAIAQVQPQGHALTCPVAPGNYCAKINYTSVSGGIRVNSTQSIGFTTGAGKAREWFRYACTAGTCFISPTNIVQYHARGTELQARHAFSSPGFFLPCGNKFGVDWRNPAVNAPGPGPVLFRVVC
jgi:hypothetical protein